MNLSQKTILAMVVTTVALVGILSAFWHAILLDSYADFEERDTRRNVERAVNALQDRIANINGHLNDWAAWDPTYRYMGGAEPTYLSDNFAGPVTLSDLGLHLIAYVGNGGGIVHQSSIDTAGEPAFAPFPADLLPHLAGGRPLVAHADPESRVSGIVMLKQAPLLVASQPIVQGSHEGPVRGALVWGRFLTAEDVHRISEMIHLSLEIHRIDDPALSDDMRAMASRLIGAPTSHIEVTPLSDTQVAGYALLKDLYGKPALLLRVDTSRAIFEQGRTSAYRSLGLLALAGLIFGVVVSILLRRIVLKRLADLSRETHRIGASGQLDLRLTVSGRDELATLAGSINGMLAHIEQAQLERREREALRRSEEQFRGLIESSPMAVLIVQHDRLIFANPAALCLLGTEEPSRVLGRPIEEFLEAAPAFQEPSVDRFFRAEVTLRRSAGEPIEVELVGSAISSQSGAAIQLVLQDIHERKQAERQLNQIAFQDTLTGLPNRVAFVRALEKAISQARGHGDQLLVMGIDLDRFKDVNDVAGHAAGDRLLIEVASRIRSALRAPDLVARLNGDEFSVLCPLTGAAPDPVRVAQRVLEQLQEPIRIDDHEFYVTPSIGLSLYPTDGESVEALTRNADIAMHRTKSSGGNSFHHFDLSMGAAMATRRTMQSSLRRALTQQEFELHYQPQVDLRTGEVVGAEALLRWHHPELGMVSPGLFIPLAEESGLIIAMTEWVMRAALEQALHWRQAGLPGLRVAVNLSARHFLGSHPQSLIRLVRTLIDELGVAPRDLELEITESVAMHNLDSTSTVLAQLHEMGVLLSIDDFGTGYSSLSYLERFPIHAIKIDRSFVRGVEQRSGNQAVIEAVVALGRALRLKVVGEGVETGAELEFVKSRGCDLVQGYLFARPMPQAEFIAWVQRWNANRARDLEREPGLEREEGLEREPGLEREAGGFDPPGREPVSRAPSPPDARTG